MHSIVLAVALTVMAVILIYAVIEWFQALNKLIKVEIFELEKIEKAKKPEGLKDISDFLKRYNQKSITIIELRKTLLNSNFNSESLEIYDWIHYAKYAAGIFVFIGLLGTVFGIASGVTELSGTVATTSELANNSFSQANWEKLLNGISNLMFGIQLASYCTMGGIVGTIVISFLNHIYLNKCRIFASRLDTFAHNYILTFTSETSKQINENNYLIELEDAVGKLNSTTSELAGNIISVSGEFIEIANATKNIMQSITKVSNKTNQVASVLETTLNEFKDENQKVSNINVEAIYSLQELLRESHVFLSSHSQNISELNQGVKENTDNLIKSIYGLSTQVESLSGSVEPFSEVTKSITNSSLKVVDSAFRMEEAVRDLSAELVKSAYGQNTHLENFVKQIYKTNDTLSALLSRFEGTLADTMAHLDSANPLKDKIAEMVGIISQLTDELTNFEQGKNEEVISKITTGVNRELKSSIAIQEAKHLESLTTILNQLNQNGESVINGVKSVNNDAANQLKSELASLNSKIQIELNNLRIEIRPKKTVWMTWWEKLTQRGYK